LAGELSIFKIAAGHRIINISTDDLRSIGVRVGSEIDYLVEKKRNELRIAIVSKGHSYKVSANGRTRTSGRIACGTLNNVLDDKHCGRHSIAFDTVDGRKAIVFAIRRQSITSTKAEAAVAK
jgi:hypothetical protein